MNAELMLLEALMAGEQSARLIPLPPTTRKRYAKRLESLGYIDRSGGKYKLTSSGYIYAIEKGIDPIVKPYFELGGADENYDNYDFSLSLKTSPLHRELEWIEYGFDIILTAALVIPLVWLIMIWTHYIR